jgi:cytidine deaminase
MSSDLERLLARAREVGRASYAPYSGFHVGAALEADDGTVFAACNVENASLGLTICAERAALSAAVSEGKTRFRRLALVTNGNQAIPPCGACRQALAEFEADLPIVSEAGADRRTWRLGELLPFHFVLARPGGATGSREAGSEDD